ncbi:hypothetical protein CFC21_059718 [Triticum aestivum]|uniref:Acidic protein n=3 Tax=Triticum TaxID=4564 RepID=A0A9R0TCZ2_TRITD|nr:hypothetical protein CFC21_059718 [Triticum aestivum]VAI11450.1 unnamed protein product [Triticum turgidum subsp. durum]
MAPPSHLKMKMKMLAVVCVLVLVGLSLSQQATASGCDDCADEHNPAVCARSCTEYSSAEHSCAGCPMLQSMLSCSQKCLDGCFHACGRRP